jgi:predicted DsbA family dithiol-disulfide isomerase
LTISAHRLIAKAYEIGGPAAQSALITPIFRAYHEDELDISDPEVLADAAEQAAIMSRAEVSVSYVMSVAPGYSPFHFLRGGCVPI